MLLTPIIKDKQLKQRNFIISSILSFKDILSSVRFQFILLDKHSKTYINIAYQLFQFMTNPEPAGREYGERSENQIKLLFLP
jgi:hypothetical protein